MIAPMTAAPTTTAQTTTAQTTTAQTTTESHLRLRGVSKSFGGVGVLKDIDLDIDKGDSLAVIGSSGTGKSVLLKCILGLTPIDKGEIILDGRDIAPLRGLERQNAMRHFGVLFQNAALFDSLSIWRNVAFSLLYAPQKQRRLPPGEARRIAEIHLEKVGLDPGIADADPASLSGGMRKRVGLARAVASQPNILLLDEPTSGLDPVTADAINAVVADCLSTSGAAVIAATHDLVGARRFARRVAMLADGEIHWQGSIEELDRSPCPMVAEFVRLAAGAPPQADARP